MRILLKMFSFFIVMVVVFLHVESVSAYGWGYSKTMDNKAPDVGKYHQILENHQAIYQDFTSEKVIYLTFDNGYEKGFTKGILDSLKEENVPATFFVTGHYVKSEPDLVKRMVSDGHIIGNHSNHHPDFTKMPKEKVEEEIKSLEKAVAAITEQKTMNYLRPPRGTFNEQTLTWIDELNYVHVFWSLAFKDWETNKQKGSEYAYDQVMKQVHPGAIVLLHTVSEDNAQALPRIIADLKKDGYSFKSLDHVLLKQQLPEDFVMFF